MNVDKISDSIIKKEEKNINKKTYKEKYEYEKQKNKMLLGLLDDLKKSNESFKESFANIESIYLQFSDFISNHKLNNLNSTEVTNTKNIYISPNSNLQNTFIKKIEELEYFYNDLTKSFNQIVCKYKIIKEENGRTRCIITKL